MTSAVPRGWNTHNMGARERSLIDEIERDALGDAPLAGALRKLVALGGQAGSTELREWASRELRGYADSDVDLPDYRRPAAVILVNAMNLRYQITGQQISPRMLPDGVREHVREEVPLTGPIGEIEAMLERARAEGGYIKLSLPGSQDVVALMNHENDAPFEQINAVYWNLAAPALSGVLDRVRTTLVELIAEMRAGMPEASETPSADVADQAVNVVVHGRSARVNVTNAQASGDGSHQVIGLPATEDPPRWRRVGTFIVGFATIGAAAIALAQWQGWGL